MPEGDSVYVAARKLDVLVGRTVTRGELRVPRHATADLSERTVLGLDTHGKHLLTRFSDDLTLHTHMLMSGTWTVSRQGKWLPRDLMAEVRVLLRTASASGGDGPAAYGISMPIVELIRTRDEHTVIGHLGPDPLRADFDADEAVRRMTADPDRAVSAVLLDQRCVAGFGNLWVNELCFLRGLNPWTPIGEVDVPALLRLGRTALHHSATVRGAYQVTTGNSRRGEQHWVAGRRGRPCLRCGTPIRVVAEEPNDPERRRTWWCPHCQPGPEAPPRR
ncbi:cytosine methyltransferase [Williamsia sp. Leaf354]|uniref:DNA-formamidopyrimidine glycosylase family protein n=1 Tax=Williamsia sp. Leaf354 TaxID=1736349 RepID=UPI0006FB153C|nr:DNA-formamidopyrimidine glycosylase family protein [Williamsia sp. Leaf354]KQR99339.1 cytosine methyltransferase [Williamsia sp. Leaf354]